MLDYRNLNAALSLQKSDGTYDFDTDKRAAKAFFLQHVNQNTVFFHSLEEKIDYLIKEGYYDKKLFDKYTFAFVKKLFKRAYDKKFRFEAFLGAFKYYTSYTMKTVDGERYLERYEDRVVLVALKMANGDKALAENLVDEMIAGRYQPATPTFLNSGKLRAGELVSCFLLRTEDNMESIGRVVNSALQLSKRGGGVAINLTNLREAGAPIKEMKNMSSGVIPVAKILEDSFSYANQLGARQGAGAIYINAHHPDIMKVLDTKRENADEKIRIKTLSLGVVVPDITMELARNGDQMYMFSPYDVEREYGVPFSDISVTEKYREMVENDNIRKTKMDARKFLQTVAEIQFESGFPYIMFEDTVNAANPAGGRVSMSNLCTEILQRSLASMLNEDLSYGVVGEDISCNLGSINIAKAMKGGDLGKTVESAVRALTNVSLMTEINSVPSLVKGNNSSHSIGLGQMNLHGYLGENKIHYGSPESIEFVDNYFMTVTYHALKASNALAIEKSAKFSRFEESTYADGSYFDKYLEDRAEMSETVKALFDNAGVSVPTVEMWKELKDSVMEHGIFNAYLQAIAPTGSISYINNATASIAPVPAMIEVRKEGGVGRVNYPQPGLRNDNKEYFKDAYEVGPRAIIDIVAAAQKHVDQGISMTLFFPHGSTTRDVNKAQIYAHKKGIKTIYYTRVKQAAEIEVAPAECESCSI